MEWILASGSPRRQELLKKLGQPFKVVKPEVVELEEREYDPHQLVLHNARLKGDWARERYPEACIFSSDTTVALGNRIFNKPVDLEEAKGMLTELSGQTHSVFTAVVLRAPEVKWEYVEESRVCFKPLSQESIVGYITDVHCLDKAGSYAIQEGRERIISKFDGSLYNIMGFPLEAIEIKLKELGYLG